VEKARRLGIGLCVLFVAGVAVWIAASAGRKSESLWADFRGGDRGVADGSGFVVVAAGAGDRPRGAAGFGIAASSDVAPEEREEDAIGPLPNVPSFLDGEVILQEDRAGLRAEPDSASGDFAGPVRWREVRVGAGETLGGIAARGGLPPKALAQANELKDADRLREGQVLFLPLTATPSDVLATLAHVRELRAKATAERKRAPRLEVTYYVVKAGDTLWSVANQFDLDVNTLIGCNRMRDVNLLKPGTTVRIPNQDGAFVVPKEGESLAALADRMGVYPEAIRAANGWGPEAPLPAGREVFVPGAKPVAFFESQTAEGRKSGIVDRLSGRTGFGWPVVGRINSGFGWRRDPFGGRRDFHTGVDIKAPTGRPIGAAAAGTVVYAGWMSGYGKTVVVEHRGGYTTLYGHCSRLLCRAGDPVSRGEKIALAGSTGRSTGSHVHFEIRVGGSPVNPLRYLR